MTQNPGGAYAPPVQQKNGNGVGVAALVLGIVAILFSFIPVVGFLSFILAPLAIILGIVGIRKKFAPKGTSIAGIILGAIALIIAIIMTVVVGSVINAVDEELNNTTVEQTEVASGEPAPAASSVPAEDSAPVEQAFPGAEESDVVGQAGEELQLGDVTVTSSALVEGDATIAPTLCSTVSLTNNSDETIDFNGFDWKLQEPGGTILDITFGGSGDALSGGQIAPGGTTGGDVCFESEGAEPGTYVLLYEPIFSFFSDRAAWINER